MRFNIQEVIQAIEGQTLSLFQTEFEGVGTDTRVPLKDLIFFPLKGDTYDAHDFLDKAVAAGASALVIHDRSKLSKELLEKLTVIEVDDTLEALQNLAHFERIKRKYKILSMTGSNGKTTTKEFTAQILSPYFKTFANQGSFNNHWGVPLTLLATPIDCEMAIVEMGMNHYHEIEKLVEIAEPDIVTCTMVGRAHIENFGSKENIAKAKYEIYQHSSEKSLRIFNIDQKETLWMLEQEKKRLKDHSSFITFSQQNTEADIFLKLDHISFYGLEISGHIKQKEIKATVPIFGAQNMTNILAASAFAASVGLSAENIQKQLSQLQTNWGRNQILNTENGITIVFDGYNANPDSFQALLDNVKLIQNAKQKIAVFGQMRELGEQSAQLHFELGEQTAKQNFDHIFFIGSDHDSFARGLGEKQKSKLSAASAYNSELQSRLNMVSKTGDVIFLKASRGTQIEQFLNGLGARPSCCKHSSKT